MKTQYTVRIHALESPRVAPATFTPLLAMKPAPLPTVKEPQTFPASSAVTASFFALLERRQHEHEQREAQARKDREDAKLARLRPWWVDAQQ